MPKINKLPAKAGTTKLISHIVVAVNRIPIVLVLKTPNRKILIFPLTPNSANAIVGITAKTRNITVINQKAFHHTISTLNTCSNKRYCTTNTIYLKNEINKTFISSGKVNSSSFWMKKEYFATKGIFSKSLMSQLISK